MLNYIYELARTYHCVINLSIGPDGTLTIQVIGKHTDYLSIGANWSEETITESILDTIRRANDVPNELYLGGSR